MEMSKEWKTYPGANDKELETRGGIPFTEDNNIGAIAIADKEGNNDMSVETYKPKSIPEEAYEGMTPIVRGADITEIVFMMYQHDCDPKKCKETIRKDDDGNPIHITRLVCYRYPIKWHKWTDDIFKMKLGIMQYIEGEIIGKKLTFLKLPSALGKRLSDRITIGREYPLEVLFVPKQEVGEVGEEEEQGSAYIGNVFEGEEGGFHFLDFLNIRLKF